SSGPVSITSSFSARSWVVVREKYLDGPVQLRGLAPRPRRRMVERQAMIRAHLEATVLTLDVGGPASMMESPTVHAAVTKQLTRGVRTVHLDLRDCTLMDSTFSGTLLSLKRLLDKLGGTMSLVSPSTKVVELLGQMGLEGFYTIESAPRAE